MLSKKALKVATYRSSPDLSHINLRDIELPVFSLLLKEELVPLTPAPLFRRMNPGHRACSYSSSLVLA